jgi:nucleoside-triphosphatase
VAENGRKGDTETGRGGVTELGSNGVSEKCEEGAIWIVTGWRDAGKTTFCRKMTQVAKAAGWDTAGILTLGEVQNGQKTGFIAEDLRTSERRSLISLNPYPKPGIILGPWYFNPETLDWGNQIFREALRCDLLVVDELGPLELIERRGWTSALEALATRQFRLALVVVRPELVDAFGKIYEVTKKIEISSNQEVAEKVESLKGVFKKMATST